MRKLTLLPNTFIQTIYTNDQLPGELLRQTPGTRRRGRMSTPAKGLASVNLPKGWALCCCFGRRWCNTGGLNLFFAPLVSLSCELLKALELFGIDSSVTETRIWQGGGGASHMFFVKVWCFKAKLFRNSDASSQIVFFTFYCILFVAGDGGCTQ